MLRLNFFPKELNKNWNAHSINRQFKLASITLLSLIRRVTLTSFISFYLVRQKTELAMVKAVKLQQLVFEMNQILEETNQLEQGYFQEILTFGSDGISRHGW